MAEENTIQRWVPLEANPAVWNGIIHKAGVDSKYNYIDFLGFDPELLAMLPKHVEAVIFLFPMTKAYEKSKIEEEAHLTKLEQNISPDVVFFRQTIVNACGMIAMLHSVASNEDEIVVTVKSKGPGLFNDIIEKAKDMSVKEREELLEQNQELAQLHASAATEGQTEAPGNHDSVEYHFICFIEVDQHLYELDGRKLFPINHGKCTNLVESATNVMKQYMARDPDETHFSAMALCKTED